MARRRRFLDSNSNEPKKEGKPLRYKSPEQRRAAEVLAADPNYGGVEVPLEKPVTGKAYKGKYSNPQSVELNQQIKDSRTKTVEVDGATYLMRNQMNINRMSKKEQAKAEEASMVRKAELAKEAEISIAKTSSWVQNEIAKVQLEQKTQEEVEKKKKQVEATVVPSPIKGTWSPSTGKSYSTYHSEPAEEADIEE